MLPIQKIIQLLKKEYPNSKCALHFKSTFQLLVATILSAQCTDKRVNLVTVDLFKRYPTSKILAKIKQGELEKAIRSTGFYRNKAKNILATARKIEEKFAGKVPKTMEELLTLPGVARKTANVILSVAYGKHEGITVDTHVRRLSQRLGLTTTQDPVKIEQDLMQIIPKKNWGSISLLLIDHGRAVCDAKKPRCHECCLAKLCPSNKN